MTPLHHQAIHTNRDTSITSIQATFLDVRGSAANNMGEHIPLVELYEELSPTIDKSEHTRMLWFRVHIRES